MARIEFGSVSRETLIGVGQEEAGGNSFFLALATYSETTQATIRVVLWAIASIVITLVYLALPYAPEIEPVYFDLMKLILGAMVLGFVLYVMSLSTKLSELTTAVTGIMADYATLGAAMYVAPQLMVPALAVFPIVALSNGTRYGSKMLAYCMLLGFIVLWFVLSADWYSDYWPLLMLAFIQIIVIPVLVHMMILALKRAKDIAQKASMAKSAFLATMSHELRTPLTAIVSGAELAHVGNPLEYVGTIQVNALNLLDTVNDVLDLSSAEHERLVVVKQAFDPASVIRQLQMALSPRASGKGIQFVIDSQMPPVFLDGDAKRLRQILTNLIGNAIKFTSAGSVTVKVRYLEPMFHAEILDTGPGISEEDLPRVCETFWQASSGADRMYAGTGLGLAIVLSLVRLMGGRLIIESELGKGSRFVVRIPIERSKEAPKALSPEDLRRLIEEHRRTIPHRRLMLVDDEKTNRDFLGRMLTKAGHEVALATSGEEAIALIRRGGWDLVLLDHHMPGCTGLQAMEKVIAEGVSVPPFIMLTGDVTDLLRQNAMSLGAVDVVPKPVMLEHLLGAVAVYAKQAGE